MPPMKATPTTIPTAIPAIATREIPFDGLAEAIEGVEIVGGANDTVVVVWKMLTDI